MKNAVYAPEAGRYINRFLETPVFEKPEEFQKTVMSGKVNEWLKYGFSINDNPCRKEFIEKKLAAVPSRPDTGRWVTGGTAELMGKEVPVLLYFPYGNVNVDHSGFWHTPTSLISYYVTWLRSEEDLGEVQFRLSTCGGVTAWFNGRETVCFRPFTRNMVKETEFTAGIHKGRTEIVICLEDLAERDTDYYFRLQMMRTDGVSIFLPLNDECDPADLKDLEQILSDACVCTDHAPEGSIRVTLDNPAGHDRTITAFLNDTGFFSRFQGSGPQFKREQHHLVPGPNEIMIKVPRDEAPGYYAVQLEGSAGPVRLTRRLGLQFTRKEWFPKEYHDLETRKKELLRFAREQTPPNCYRAVALLAEGKEIEKANRMLRNELPLIRAHGDCSDFFLIAHLYALKAFRPLLEPDVIGKIEDAVLTFRYWIDEPGNDVMWFFSENHALGFHACQYIAGKMFPDSVFEASGLTGREAEAKALRLLGIWFDAFEEEFMTEWNSNAYLPVDATAFAFLLLMVEKDDPLRERIIRGLDRLFRCLCLYTVNHCYLSSYGRSYERQLNGNLVNGTTSLMYYGYGEGGFTGETGPYVPLCLSDYVPPPEYREYLYPGKDRYLWSTNNQGYERHVDLTLYKTDHVLLSAANAFKPYKPGYQEHICEAAIDALTYCFVNHPGETCAFGSGRPSYWAGNGCLPLAAQWMDFSVLRYKNPGSSIVRYTHAYFPREAFERVIHGDDWYAGEKNGGYLFVWAANGLRRQEKGPYRSVELISGGDENVWVLRVGDRDLYGDLEHFASDSGCSIEELTPDRVTLHLNAWGSICLRDEGSHLWINGQPAGYAFTTRGSITFGKRRESF